MQDAEPGWEWDVKVSLTADVQPGQQHSAEGSVTRDAEKGLMPDL